MVALLSQVAEVQFTDLKNESDWALHPEQQLPSSEEHPFTLRDVLDLSFETNKEIAFRSAWLLEHLTLEYQGLSVIFDVFLKRLPELKNLSAMRHHGKIFAWATSKKASEGLRRQLLEKELDAEVELFFGWLIEESTPVAVKVHAMQSLANLVPRYSWIKDELLETISHLESRESIAFFARAKQVRKQLKKA